MEQETASFGAFYEQMIHYTWTVVGSIAILILLYRLCRLFFRYINTGGWDEFYKSCYGYHLMDGDGFDPEYMPLLFRGCHPGAIMLDIISLLAASFIAGVAWLPLSIILPFIGIAYLLRKKIAKKQDFIAKLDGTHPEISDSGSEDMAQAVTNQAYTGGGQV